MGASAVTIEEITGQRRRLVLKGGGLPRRGAEWGGSTVLVTEWNPGNVEATQHVLASPLDPSDWEGEWNTTRLLRSPCTFREAGGADRPVVLAHDLLEIVDRFRRDAQLLRVTWTTQVTEVEGGTRPFKISRRGRMANATFKVTTQDDIAWGISFEWVSYGEQQKKTVDTSGQDMLAKLRAAIVAAEAASKTIAEDQIRKLQEDRKSTATKFTLGQLEQLAEGPLELVDSFARVAINVASRLRELGNVVLKVRDTPAAIAGRVVDVARTGVSVSNDFLDRVSRQGPEMLSTRNKVSSLTRSASYYSRAQQGAQRMASVMNELMQVAKQRQQRYLESAGPDAASAGASQLVKLHLPVKGETMQSIALRFYGEDVSAELNRANGLPAHQVVPPRTALLIPARGQLRSDQVSSV